MAFQLSFRETEQFPKHCSWHSRLILDLQLFQLWVTLWHIFIWHFDAHCKFLSASVQHKGSALMLLRDTCCPWLWTWVWSLLKQSTKKKKMRLPTPPSDFMPHMRHYPPSCYAQYCRLTRGTLEVQYCCVDHTFFKEWERSALWVLLYNRCCLPNGICCIIVYSVQVPIAHCGTDLSSYAYRCVTCNPLPTWQSAIREV